MSMARIGNWGIGEELVSSLAVQQSYRARLDTPLALVKQKIKDRLAALPPKERQQIEADFVDLATQQPVFSEAYRKRGLKDIGIRNIYHSFMGEKFLTEEEQDFEAFMAAQGLEIVEE